jgi:hypothetical protein
LQIFDLIKLLYEDFEPSKTKIHLATRNNVDNPLDIYLAGNFEEWQKWQTKENFKREFVISLIELSTPNKWLFAGLFKSSGASKEKELYYYHLEQIQDGNELSGRIIASFSRPGRNSYLLGENWETQILLDSILPERLRIKDFPGYKAIDLSKQEIDIIIKQGIESWRTALSNVSGIYLISDTKSSKLYVGKASGEGGIWQRWTNYSENGHGGNIELKKLLKAEGADRASFFRFSILEITDIHDSEQAILYRESHWKSVLLSSVNHGGLNAN